MVYTRSRSIQYISRFRAIQHSGWSGKLKLSFLLIAFLLSSVAQEAIGQINVLVNTLPDSMITLNINSLDSILRKGPYWTTTEYKSGYHYIPVDRIRADSISRLVWNGKVMEDSTPGQTLNIYWHSMCTDGSYNLSITPEQIFLHSGHDNPNPNYLYWVYPVKPDVFRVLSEKLEASHNGLRRFERRSGSVDYLDTTFQAEYDLNTEWTDSFQNALGAMCELRRQQQVARIMERLEQLYGDKFILASSLSEEFNPIVIGWNLGVMELSLPRRISNDTKD